MVYLKIKNCQKTGFSMNINVAFKVLLIPLNFFIFVANLGAPNLFIGSLSRTTNML